MPSNERLHTNPEQAALPDMELVNYIEGLSVEDRIAHKRRYLSEISDREALCRMIDEVNDAEGYTRYAEHYQ